jgi:ribonuclease P protein component
LFSFGKDRRLLSQKDFSRVYKRGKRQYASCLTLVYTVAILNQSDRSKNCERSRLGLSVSRKVGCAVVRNLIKRRLREIYRLNQHNLSEGTDLVLIPKPEAATKEYKELETVFIDLLTKANLWKL